jgi:DNA-binding SARP family transcriptional activator
MSDSAFAGRSGVSGCGRHDAPDEHLSLFVLGGFELRAGPRVLRLPVNAERIVAFLAIRDRPQLRSTVASTLWMDTGEDRAAANLRTALWRLRQAGAAAVVTHGAYLALASDVSVDLFVLVSRARTIIGPATDDDDVDPRVFSRDLLPEWDDEWVRFERERLRQLRVHALEGVCARLSDAGRHAEAIDAGQAAVAAEPLRESAQRTLIQAHLAEGNICEAKRQLDLYCSLLDDSMGFAPSRALTELVAAAVTPRRRAGR